MNIAEQRAIQLQRNKAISELASENINRMKLDGTLKVPANYSVENALKSAMLMLPDVKDRNKIPALQVVTVESAANALLDMVVQGLNPMKKQGYFIVYGDKLTFQRSYFGNLTIVKRNYDVTNITATVIYDEDEIEYEIIDGEVRNLSHKQKFSSINSDNIVGAYAVIKFADGSKGAEIMTIAEIKKSWDMGRGMTKVHKDFTQEMAKKTVLNRLCKRYANSSDDSELYYDDNTNEFAEIENEANKVEKVVLENANAELIDIEETEMVEVLDVATQEVEVMEQLEEVSQQQASFDEELDF